jgi:hypothetical protein
MEVQQLPIVLFDNQCYWCEKFIRIVNFFARDKIPIVGHYSDFGIKIRNKILDESALDMFWFINKNTAYGGRAAIMPLVNTVLFRRTKNVTKIKVKDECKQNCKTVKAFFTRTSSLFRNSKTIKIDLDLNQL